MKALADKVLVLGIDGMDPKLTQKFMDEGYMPNVQKFITKGSAENKLHMIGGFPTVTPPMWTTLATGTNPSTHGITEYYAKHPEKLDVIIYNFDSTKCKAEPLWNATAEAGKKTLVWHWPGSSWPPTSDNLNLHVVDGTQPGGINCGVAEVDSEKLIIASEKTEEVLYRKKAATDSNVPCFIPGMEMEEESDELSSYDKVHAVEVEGIAIEPEESYHNLSDTPLDICYSPIRPATNWTDAPEDAKEFTILHNGGMVRRICQIRKNEQGIYDTVFIFKSKKETKPLAICKVGVFVEDVIDEAYKKDEKILANRNMRVLELAEDGSKLKMWVSGAMDFHNDNLWHPKSLLNEIVANVGYPQPICMAGSSDEQLISKCARANWDRAANWNAKSLKYMMRNGGYSVIFSHFHNIDLQGHLLVKFLKNGSNKMEAETYNKLFRDVYVQTDCYIGEFLEMLDEGWTIIIVSDHGQVCPEHGRTDFLPGTNAVNAIYFEKWGYLTLKRDAEGNRLHEIDWTKTVAVPQRCNSIYINLKGRDTHVLEDGTTIDGLVDPEDKYELEEKIMTDLYSLKHPVTGYRIISLALRNRDAIIIGDGGPEAGDIIFVVAEGYTDDHGDSLPTFLGTNDTTVASVFMAAGKGIKKDFKTDRVIKHIDVAPTVAMLAGVRVPANCEGAPIYQIIDEEGIC